MAIPRKFTIGLPLALLLLLGLAVGAMAIFGVPVERFRPRMVAEINRVTGMRCDIAAVKMSFTELRVHGIRIAPPAGGEPFCTIGAAKVRLDWDLVQALLTGGAAVIQEFAADDVFLHIDPLEKLLEARPAAPAPAEDAFAAMPAAAPAPLGAPVAPAPAAAAPVLQVMRLEASNLRFRMHGVEMAVRQLSGRRDAGGMVFTADGKIGAAAIVSRGNLQLFQHDGLLQARQIEASFTIQDLPLRVFYQLFPQSLDLFQKQGMANGDLDISYSWHGAGELGFSGAVDTSGTVAWLFDQEVPVPDSHWDFSGSFADEKLTIDKFALKGRVDDFQLDGYADFRQSRQVFKIASSGLSFPFVCHAVGNRLLADQMQGLVAFQGFVAVTGDDVEVKGEGSAQELRPQFPPLSDLTRAVSGHCDFAYRSNDCIIHLANLALRYDFGEGSGALRFPWLRPLTADNFACDLALESELAPLSGLVGLSLGGRVRGQVKIATPGAKELQYQAELRGVKEVNAKFGNGETLDIGKFRFAIEGSSFWEEGRHVLKRVDVETTPLHGTLRGAHANGRTDLAYALRLEPRTLWPFWVHELKGQVNAAVFGPLALQGKAAIDADGALELADTLWRGVLLRGQGEEPWYYALSFGGRAALGGAQDFSVKGGSLKVYDRARTLAAIGFDLAGARRPADGGPPNVTVGSLLQTTMPALRAIHQLLGLGFPPSLDGGALAVRSQVTYRPDAPAVYKLSANLADARTSAMMRPQQIALQGSLEDRARVDGSLIFRDWRLATADKALDVAGGGRVFSLEQPQAEFALRARCNLEKALQALDLRPPCKLSGMVEGEAQIRGALHAPQIQASAKAADIVIDNGARLRRLVAPRAEGAFTFNWDPRSGDVTQVKIPSASLRTADWQLQLSGQAERLRYRHPTADGGGAAVLDFGKGMACNYLLSGKRTFLPWLVPELSPLAGGAPDTPESLTSRGIIRAKEIPLSATAEGDFRLMRSLQVQNGLTLLDHLQAGRLGLKGLSLPYELAGGVFAINDGRADCGGPVLFNASVDFNHKLPAGAADLCADGLDLAAILGRLAPDTEIVAGRAYLPAGGKGGRFVHATWQGADLNSILDTLKIPSLTLLARGLAVKTVTRPFDWEEVLKYDFHQSVAREIAQQLAAMEAENAGKPRTYHLRELEATGSVDKRCLTLNPCLITGDDTADARCVGRVFFDRRLQLRLWPTDNLDRHFDAAAMAANPKVKEFLDTLPPARRSDALRLVPEWLNGLARGKKLYVDVKGTLDDPVVDPRGVRDGVKQALTPLVTRAVELMGQSSIVTEILGKDALKNAGKNGKPLINLDDILK